MTVVGGGQVDSVDEVDKIEELEVEDDDVVDVGDFVELGLELVVDDVPVLLVEEIKMS